MLFPSPALIAIVSTQNQQEPNVSLCTLDPQLKTNIPAQELVAGNITNLAKWIRLSLKLLVGTTESEMNLSRDLFVFGDARAGDVMEAYGLLYRMKWVKYRRGNPTYELTLGKDSVDNIHAPRDDFQARRSEAIKAFMKSFDEMSLADRRQVFSGQPLYYSKLPQTMQDAMKSAIGALIDGNARNAPNVPKPDIDSLTEAQIKLNDESKPGTGIREIWFSVSTAVGGSSSSYSFRWNDYDKAKSYSSSSRPIAFSQEPSSDEVFSKEAMAAKSKKMAQPITIPQKDWTLAALLKYLHTNFDINFITNEDREKRPHPFSCENIPLKDVMDQISKEYGDWEWEVAPGDFIVMRSPGSPRRRSKAFTQ